MGGNSPRYLDQSIANALVLASLRVCFLCCPVGLEGESKSIEPLELCLLDTVPVRTRKYTSLCERQRTAKAKTRKTSGLFLYLLIPVFS